jgi:pimeloyl-ACP methyl ester carboxylesterase
MATFVLVHGASHGGWCWRDVRAALQSNGHDVFTPTLTGLGERSHLLSPDIDLNTHILDVVNVLEWEELTDVILVGHSYGGHVITGVADRAKSQLRHIVYLDAYIPADGESPLTHGLAARNPDITAAEIQAELDRRRSATNEKGGVPSHVPNLFDVPEDRPELYDWVSRRITLHPLNSQLQTIHLENDGSEGLPRTYIVCTESSLRSAYLALAEMAKTSPNWRYRELATGHDAMVTLPEETAALLMEIADV